MARNWRFCPLAAGDPIRSRSRRLRTARSCCRRRGRTDSRARGILVHPEPPTSRPDGLCEEAGRRLAGPVPRVQVGAEHEILSRQQRGHRLRLQLAHPGCAEQPESRRSAERVEVHDANRHRRLARREPRQRRENRDAPLTFTWQPDSFEIGQRQRRHDSRSRDRRRVPRWNLHSASTARKSAKGRDRG